MSSAVQAVDAHEKPEALSGASGGGHAESKAHDRATLGVLGAEPVPVPANVLLSSPPPTGVSGCAPWLAGAEAGKRAVMGAAAGGGLGGRARAGGEGADAAGMAGGDGGVAERAAAEELPFFIDDPPPPAVVGAVIVGTRVDGAAGVAPDR